MKERINSFLGDNTCDIYGVCGAIRGYPARCSQRIQVGGGEYKPKSANRGEWRPQIELLAPVVRLTAMA